MATPDNSTTTTIPSNLTDVLQQLREIVVQQGIDGCKKLLADNLERGKYEKLNIAVTGNSGQGKSRLINSLRRLKCNDSGYAKVGVIETTANVKDYPDPKNVNIVYWDLPGCGTEQFPCKTYLEQVEFNKYDFYLIVTATRFTENDLWLVDEVIKLGKRFYLIRTKIDLDVANEKQEYPEKRQSEVLRSIKENCLNELKKRKEKPEINYPVYLISSVFELYGKWNFPKLLKRLLSDCSTLQHEVLVATITANCQEIIEQKVKLLQSRIWNVAALSAALATVAITGTSVAADLLLLHQEIEKYKKSLGLDTDSLNKLSETCGVKREDIEAELVKAKLATMVFTPLASLVKELLFKYATAQLLEEAARFIPIIGTFIVAPAISFGTIYKVLQLVLDEMKEASLKLLNLTKSKMGTPITAEDDDFDDDNLHSEISSTLEDSRHKPSRQSIRTTSPLPITLTSISPTVSAPIPVAETPVNTLTKPRRSSKWYCRCCLRH